MTELYTVALRINKTDDAADFSDILTDDVLSALRVDLNRSVQVPNAPVAKKTGPKAPQKTRGTASKLSSGMFGITNAQAPTVVDSTETYKTVVRSLIRVTKVLQTTSDNLKLLARMAEYCSVVSEQLCSTRITVADETFECEKVVANCVGKLVAGKQFTHGLQTAQKLVQLIHNNRTALQNATVAGAPTSPASADDLLVTKLMLSALVNLGASAVGWGTTYAHLELDKGYRDSCVSWIKHCYPLDRNTAARYAHTVHKLLGKASVDLFWNTCRMPQTPKSEGKRVDNYRQAMTLCAEGVRFHHLAGATVVHCLQAQVTLLHTITQTTSPACTSAQVTTWLQYLKAVVQLVSRIWPARSPYRHIIEMYYEVYGMAVKAHLHSSVAETAKDLWRYIHATITASGGSVAKSASVANSVANSGTAENADLAAEADTVSINQMLNAGACMLVAGSMLPLISKATADTNRDSVTELLKFGTHGLKHTLQAWADTGIPLGSNSTVDATKVCGNIRKGCAQARTDSRECTDTRTHTHTHTTPGVCAVVQSGKTTREKISASADSTRDGISWSVGQAMAFCLEELVHFLDKLRACIIKPGMKQTLNIKLLTSDTEASAKVLKVLEEAAYVIGKLFCVLGKSETISDSTRTAVCEPLSSCFTLATGLRIQLDALDSGLFLAQQQVPANASASNKSSIPKSYGRHIRALFQLRDSPQLLLSNIHNVQPHIVQPHPAQPHTIQPESVCAQATTDTSVRDAYKHAAHTVYGAGVALYSEGWDKQASVLLDFGCRCYSVWCGGSRDRIRKIKLSKKFAVAGECWRVCNDPNKASQALLQGILALDEDVNLRAAAAYNLVEDHLMQRLAVCTSADSIERLSTLSDLLIEHGVGSGRARILLAEELRLLMHLCTRRKGDEIQKRAVESLAERSVDCYVVLSSPLDCVSSPSNRVAMGAQYARALLTKCRLQICLSGSRDVSQSEATDEPVDQSDRLNSALASASDALACLLRLTEAGDGSFDSSDSSSVQSEISRVRVPYDHPLTQRILARTSNAMLDDLAHAYFYFAYIQWSAGNVPSEDGSNSVRNAIVNALCAWGELLFHRLDLSTEIPRSSADFHSDKSGMRVDNSIEESRKRTGFVNVENGTAEEGGFVLPSKNGRQVECGMLRDCLADPMATYDRLAKISDLCVAENESFLLACAMGLQVRLIEMQITTSAATDWTCDMPTTEPRASGKPCTQLLTRLVHNRTDAYLAMADAVRRSGYIHMAQPYHREAVKSVQAMPYITGHSEGNAKTCQRIRVSISESKLFRDTGKFSEARMAIEKVLQTLLDLPGKSRTIGSSEDRSPSKVSRHIRKGITLPMLKAMAMSRELQGSLHVLQGHTITESMDMLLEALKMHRKCVLSLQHESGAKKDLTLPIRAVPDSSAVAKATMSSIVCVRDLLMCMQQAGQMYEMQGAFREAEYYYKDALNIARAHGLKGVATQLLLRRADIASRRNEYQTTSDMLAEATLLLGQPHQNLKIEIPTGQALASQIHSGKYEGVAVEANTPSKFGTISLIPSREDLMDTDEDLAQVGSSTTTPIKGGLEPKRCLAGELVDITNTHTFTHRRSSTHTRTSPKGTLPQNVIYDTPSTLTCTASSLTKDGAGDNPALPQMETGQSPVLAQKGAQDSPEPIGNGLEDPPVALPWPVMRTRVDTSLGMAAVYMSCGDMVLKRDNNFQESLRLYRLALKCLTDVREARVGIAVATLQTKLNQARRPPVHAPQQDAQPTYEAHVQVTLELGTHAMHTHDSAEASDRRQMDVGGITQRTHTHTPGEVLVHSTRPRKRVKRSGPGATVNRCGMYSSDSGTRESLNLKKDQSDDRGMTDVQSDCSELCSSQSDDGEGGESESECSQSQRQRVPTPANVLRREDKARVLVRIAWVRFLRVSSGGRRERERCSVCVCTCACTCACAGVWESGCGRVRQTKCGYAPAQRRTQSLHSSIDADGEAHTHTHIHAEAHKQTGTDVAINEQGNTGVGVHNQPTSDTHGHTRVRAHMPAPADSGEEGVCLHRRMSDIVNILRHNVYHIRPGIARTESLYRLGAVMCWAGNAGIPLVDSGLSINSADVLLAEAKGYLKTALNACGSLPAPFLQRRICLKLLQLTNESDAYSRFYYHNRSLAVTFLHQMGHRNHSHSAEVEALDMTCDFGNMSALEWDDTVDSDNSAGHDATEVSGQTLPHPGGPLKDKVLAQLPSNWTTCTLSLIATEETSGTHTHTLAITRASAAGEPVSVELECFPSYLPPNNQPSNAAAPATNTHTHSNTHPSTYTHTHKDILTEFAAVMDTMHKTMQSTEHITTTAQKKQWWGARAALDDRLNALVRDMQTQWLGPWQGLLLGSRCDAEQRVAIATAGTELCDRVNEVIGQMGGHRHSERTNSAEGAHSINRTAPAKNRAAKLQLCEILVDSHGLLSEIEITQALQYIVHGRAGGATFDADQSESSFKKRSCSTEAFNWKAASTPNQKALNLSSADLAGEEINGCVFSTESVCDDDIEMVRENIETTLYPQLPLSGAQVDCSCTEQGPKPKINGTRCTRNTKLEANREPEEGDGPVHAKPAQTSGSRQLSGRRQTGEPAANTLAGEVRRVENASTSPEPSSDSGQISRTAGEPLLERSNGDALITELRAFLQHVCDKAGVVVMATDRVAGRDPSTPPSNDSRASVQRRTVKPYTHTRNPTTLPPTHTPTPPPMAVRTSTRTRTRTSTLERAFRDSAEGMGGPQSVERDHVILMLDKSVQHLPWECLPLLSNQAVSRMPCAESIVSALASADETATGSDEAPTDPRLTVDVADTYYVLNPEGDLQNTEKTFANDFQSCRKWTGITGILPTAQAIQDALETRNLYVYLGHGGGEKYLSRNKIQDLKCRAVALLLGCSSGRLKDNGDFDSTGTPLSYMLAGCPAALGLLWDVTDKDIDRFAQQLLSLWIDEEDAMSLSTATTMSRRVCKFELLTGGAAVVYGIPAYAKKSTEK